MVVVCLAARALADAQPGSLGKSRGGWMGQPPWPCAPAAIRDKGRHVGAVLQGPGLAVLQQGPAGTCCYLSAQFERQELAGMSHSRPPG